MGVASLAGRRWGPAVSGWLVGLPFTSAPVAFFLARERGVDFAAAAAAGTVAGAVSQAAFCLAYAWLARGAAWPAAVGGGSAGFAVATAALSFVGLPPLPILALGAVGLLALASAAMPRSGARGAALPAPLPRWDLPARMVVATVFVIVLTGVAGALGPRLTGLLAPFPLYAAILTVFAHVHAGAAAAASVLRGLLVGLVGFVAFFLVLGCTLVLGIAPAFALALAVALLVHGATLVWLRRAPR